MVFAILTIKYILVIFNCSNVVCNALYILTTWILSNDHSDELEKGYSLLCYFSIIISAGYCVAALMENAYILQTAAHITISKIVGKVLIWVLLIQFSWFMIFFEILQIIIAALSLYLAKKIHKRDLELFFQQATCAAAIPLNPMQ